MTQRNSSDMYHKNRFIEHQSYMIRKESVFQVNDQASKKPIKCFAELFTVLHFMS